jgi:hypothetical protein
MATGDGGSFEQRERLKKSLLFWFVLIVVAIAIWIISQRLA